MSTSEQEETQVSEYTPIPKDLLVPLEETEKLSVKISNITWSDTAEGGRVEVLTLDEPKGQYAIRLFRPLEDGKFSHVAFRITSEALGALVNCSCQAHADNLKRSKEAFDAKEA